MKNPRILELLAQGITPSQVLSIVGCSVDFLKELLQDTEFSEELEKKKKEYFAEADEEIVIGNKYLSLEHKILKRIESELGNADMRDAIRALEVVSSRQEKSKNRMNSGYTGDKKVVNIVNVSIPMHAIPEYTLNSNKEVISVGSVGMTPMSGSNVRELFNSISSGEKLVSSL